MDFLAPNFDQILHETGIYSQNGFQLLWKTITQGIAVDLPAAIQLAKDVLEPKVLSDAPSAQQDDYTVSKASVILFTGAVAFNLTGIKAPDPGRARLIVVHVTGAGTVTLKHESASSQANNRLHCKSGADTAIATDQSAVLLYLSSRYRQIV